MLVLLSASRNIYDASLPTWEIYNGPMYGVYSVCFYQMDIPSSAINTLYSLTTEAHTTSFKVEFNIGKYHSVEIQVPGYAFAVGTFLECKKTS